MDTAIGWPWRRAQPQRRLPPRAVTFQVPKGDSRLHISPIPFRIQSPLKPSLWDHLPYLTDKRKILKIFCWKTLSRDIRSKNTCL